MFKVLKWDSVLYAWQFILNIPLIAINFLEYILKTYKYINLKVETLIIEQLNITRFNKNLNYM